MSNFLQGQGNQEIARRRAFRYVAQEIAQIDVEIAEKGHLWMEINNFPYQIVRVSFSNSRVHNLTHLTEAFID